MPIKTNNATSDTAPVLPKLWTTKALADYTQKSVAWFERARWNGTGPRFIKLGRHVRYRAEDVEAWINQSSTEGAA